MIADAMTVILHNFLFSKFFSFNNNQMKNYHLHPDEDLSTNLGSPGHRVLAEHVAVPNYKSLISFEYKTTKFFLSLSDSFAASIPEFNYWDVEQFYYFLLGDFLDARYQNYLHFLMDQESWNKKFHTAIEENYGLENKYLKLIPGAKDSFPEVILHYSISELFEIFAAENYKFPNRTWYCKYVNLRGKVEKFLSL